MAVRGGRVVISGGGLGGMALALGLIRPPQSAALEKVDNTRLSAILDSAVSLQNPREVVVVERDDAVDARDQGYNIGLNASAGVEALTALGLRPQLDAMAEAGQGLTMYDAQAGGKKRLEMMAQPGSKHEVVRVSRPALRRMLYESVKAADTHGRVKFVWGDRVTGFESGVEIADGNRTGVRVLTGSGTEIEADLLVGADGVHSGVRRAFNNRNQEPDGTRSSETDAKPLRFLKHVLVSGRAVGMPTPPWLHGSVMILGGPASLFLWEGDTEIGFSFTMPSASLGALNGLPEAEVVEIVAEQVKDWEMPALDPLAFLEHRNERGLRVRDLHDRDPLEAVGMPHVTLLGDAAHPMTPFQGLGANTALEDAVDLAACLHMMDSVEEALPLYEGMMIPRGDKAATRSRTALHTFHPKGWIMRTVRNAGLSLLGRLGARREDLDPPTGDKGGTGDKTK